MTAPGLIAVAVAWLMVLAFRQTRTARAVTLLASLTVVGVSTYALPEPAATVLRLAIVAIGLVVIVRFPGVIWYLSGADRRFDEFISRCVMRLRQSERMFEGSAHVVGGRTSGLRDLQQDLQAYSAPDPVWEHVREHFLDHLQLDLDVVEGRADAKNAAAARVESWQAMRDSWERARESRGSFWR